MLTYAPAAVYLDAADHLTKSTDVIRLSPFGDRPERDGRRVLPGVARCCFLAGVAAVRFLPPATAASLWLPGGVLLLLSWASSSGTA